jgi:hypothetical protein
LSKSRSRKKKKRPIEKQQNLRDKRRSELLKKKDNSN